ncbi:hypothetical protein N0V95_010179, partial [Ascochyta clinopodiicola]
DMTRDEAQSLDAQNSTESYESRVIRLLRQFISNENERAQNQDHVMKLNFQEVQTLRERQDAMNALLDTIRKQLHDIQSLTKNQHRRSDPLSLPGNSQYTRGTRPEQLSLSTNAQYAPAVRPDHLSFQGNV